jgi:hypothetical protein
MHGQVGPAPFRGLISGSLERSTYLSLRGKIFSWMAQKEKLKVKKKKATRRAGL